MAFNVPTQNLQRHLHQLPPYIYYIINTKNNRMFNMVIDYNICSVHDSHFTIPIDYIIVVYECSNNEEIN